LVRRVRPGPDLGRARRDPAPAGTLYYAAELQQLATLKRQGILTEEEFEAKKKQIILGLLRSSSALAVSSSPFPFSGVA
jgi:hypothetical protein